VRASRPAIGDRYAGWSDRENYSVPGFNAKNRSVPSMLVKYETPHINRGQTTINIATEGKKRQIFFQSKRLDAQTLDNPCILP